MRGAIQLLSAASPSSINANRRELLEIAKCGGAFQHA